MNNQPFTKPILITNPVANNDALRSKVYATIEEALGVITPELRAVGRTFEVQATNTMIKQYWWQNPNDLSDGGISLKTSPIEQSDNPTRVIQMLPPIMGSTPRRVIIPVIDSALNEVDLIFAVNDNEFVKSTQQEILIPDASENHYRKDLILGTATGDVIRFEGIESLEGIIDPVQPPDTVYLTHVVVFGDTISEDPEPPSIGFIKKTNWIDIIQSGGDTQLSSLNENIRHFVIKGYSGAGGVTGLSFRAPTLTSGAYQGQEIIIDNDTEFEIPLLHNFNNTLGDFTFPNEEDYLLKPRERVIFNVKGSKISFSSSNMAIVDELPADQVSYNNTTSGLDAENAQDAFDELEDKKLDKVTTSTPSIELYAKEPDGSQSMIDVFSIVDNHRNFNISVSQTTNIVMISFFEKVAITDLVGITNVDDFVDFYLWNDGIPKPKRDTIVEINADIAGLDTPELALGYTIQFRIVLTPGQSNASAIFKSIKI